MAILHAKMNWGGGLKFTGTSAFGHSITTDIAKDKGGDESGYRPTELVLFAVAGCTGVDVVRILQKQRQELTGLEISVEARDTEELPKYFETVNVTYRFKGKNLDLHKLEQAVELSESKYCTVSESLKQNVKVTTSIEILPD
ncbi:MAG: OsmC family protein [bacterium]|jgi:putative redox protein|nr:OsmC family protein [bacterium]